MAAPARSTTLRLSTTMERKGQWDSSQEIPCDVDVEIGGTSFPLHKFMLVAKSNYVRKLILDSKDPDLSRINLSDIPGGAEMFEKAARFCYGVNFEITVHNVAGLRCAAEFLQMTDAYCENNLAGRTEDFLSQVALCSLSGAVAVLKSCENLLPVAEEHKIVQRCIDVISVKGCNESNFPSRSPPNWWTEELTVLPVSFLSRVMTGMKKRGAKPMTIASLLVTYTESNLCDFVRSFAGAGAGAKSSRELSTELKSSQRELLESIVALLPAEKSAFPVNFLCSVLRSATILKASSSCRSELEKRISTILEQITTDDLLLLSTTDGVRQSDFDSVKKIIAGYVEKEKTHSVFNGGAGFRESVSSATQRVAKVVDAYLGEIATFEGLSISKFNGIAMLIPKGARKVDDDLYRAVDIYLKTHPNLEEIEREKVCSVMDPLKLSYEARLHASQNKRLPVQIVLHALYYDQLKIRSGDSEISDPAGEAAMTRNQLQTDSSLIRENEALRSELMKMKMYISEMQKSSGSTSSKGASSGPSKPTFFSAMSKKLGKLNPFRNTAKDTSNIVENGSRSGAKPKKRRFSIS